MQKGTLSSAPRMDFVFLPTLVMGCCFYVEVYRGGLSYFRLDYNIRKGIGGDGFEEMRRETF
jgi:hypothetical protein